MATIPYLSKRLRAMGMPQAAADLFSDPNNAVPKVKRVTMSLGAPRTVAGAGALTDWAERIPVHLPVNTTRWRLRVANRQLTNAPGVLTQVFTLSDIVLGTLTGVTAQGRTLASYGVAPTKVLDGFSNPADGSDYVTPWVTDPTMQFGPAGVKTIGLTLSGTNNGNGSATTSSHYGFRRSTAGAAGSLYTLTNTGYLGNTLALDKRLEYEFVGDNSVGMYVGASGDEGYNLTTALDGLGGYEFLPAHESWPGAYGMAKGIPWVNTSIVGATEAPFQSSSSLAFTRFDLATTVPDFAVVNLGGNTIINGGAVLATVQSQVFTTVSILRGFGIKRIYLCTIPPVGLTAGDAKEIMRVAYNAWARNLPLGIQGLFDVDLLMRDYSVPQNQIAGFVTADNIHPTHAGYQRWATAFTVL